MITAIIRNKENTLVLELPHSIYDIYEKLQSIGIMQPPKQIPLTDNEGEDIGVKLFSESDFGQHLLLTLNEKNTIADANMLTLVIGAASEDIKEELEQNVLYDQYDSMDEVIFAVHQMTQDAGPVKAAFFCPLVGNIDEGDGDMFTVGDSYLADSADEIADALKRYTANDENDMAAYYNKDDGVSEKLASAVWSVELHGDRLFGRIDCSLKEALTAEETEALRDWLTGQCSDGLGEGFEQQPIDTMDGELFVSFWNSGDDYGFDSVIPQITSDMFDSMRDIYTLNTLAQRISAMNNYEQVKFKAVLDAENTASIHDALNVAHNLWRYEFAAEPDTADGFFKKYIYENTSTEFDSKWLENLLPRNEADKLLGRIGATLTDYGVISARNGHLFKPVPYDEPEAKELKTQALTEEKLDVIEVLDRRALFSNGRLMPEEIPEGLYAYDLRYSDESCRFCSIEPKVLVDHGGTVLMKDILDFGTSDQILLDDETEPNFLGDEMTPSEFAEEEVQDEAMQMGGM